MLSTGSEKREGTLSVIGAVSPAGGDISEPVSQATLRIVKVFWGLDSSLAYKRHFPAINWLTSYSLYADSLGKWFNENVNESWTEKRKKVLSVLSEEAQLEEIVKLIGMDALSPADRMTMETARSIREDFLHQLAFHDVDTYTSLHKQYLMISLILLFHSESQRCIKEGVSVDKIVSLSVREKIGRFKYIKEENVDNEYNEIIKNIETDFDSLLKGEGE